MLGKISEDQKRATSGRQVCDILVAAQLMQAWLAVAQTNPHPALQQRSSAIQVNTIPVAAVVTGRTTPAIAVSPRSLDFASVVVGETSNLTFTVRNVGGGILTGAAKVSAPFRVVRGSPYVLANSQSQAITLQFGPKAAGMNITVVHLTGGGGASVTVAGSALPAARTAPAPPQGLRLLAGR